MLLVVNLIGLLSVVAYARDLITNLTLVTSDASIISLFQTVIDVLEGTTSTFGTSTYPTTAGSYQTAPRIAASIGIQSNIASLQSDVSDYIQETYPNVYYDNAKCSRDLGHIIDRSSKRFGARHQP